MAPTTATSSTLRKSLVGVLIATLVIGAVVLTLLALDHVRTRPVDREVAPLPTFTQPSAQTPSPTPSETVVAPVSYDRSQERFLAVSTGVLWRGVAGECGAVEPSLERSLDGGETWTDVTPRYLEIGQLIALNPFADGQAEIVALMGVDCELRALRTFTQGQFWEPYDDALAAAQYVDPAAPGTIVRAGASIAAPCGDARNLRTAGAVAGVICEGTAYILGQNQEWTALSSVKPVGLSVSGESVVVAHLSDDCAGVAVARFSPTSAGDVQDARCVDDAPQEVPVAVVDAGADLVIWSGGATTMSPL